MDETKKDKKVEIQNRVNQVIKNMFKLSQEQGLRKLPAIGPKTDIFKDLGIDSVEVLDLIGSIEKEFGITMEPDRIAQKRMVEEIVEYINECLKDT